MTTSFCDLNFDILFYIISELHLDDAVHLGRTCRQLKAVLDEQTICRRILSSLPHTDEARLALAGKATYKEALQAIYDRRHALSNTAPFSIRVLGQGSSFLCRQGVICVLKDEFIQVSQVHSAATTFRFNLAAVLRPPTETSSSWFQNCRVSLLYYSDGILSLLVEPDSRPNNPCIVAVSTATKPLNGRRNLMIIPLESSSKVFVRHTSRYLYYGTHTGIGDDGHHKWEISGHSFDEKNHPLPDVERPLLLENFHGTDIGSTVAFEIKDDFFYAVSNQGTFEVEEVDWTSFYHCVRFPLDNPDPKKAEKNERVFRRQHAQGPIHDSWTDLSLQVSEETGNMMIIESRREWEKASSRQSRTFYVSKFESGNSSYQDLGFSDGEFDKPMLPKDDIFVDVLDSSNKPNYMPTPPLFSWSQHPEFCETDISPRSFTLSRTKFRAYNYSCTTFLDLVEDDRCCSDSSRPPCLRLRIGSRREAQPFLPPSLSKGKARIDTEPTLPEFDDKYMRYRHAPIRMFPPPASTCPCSARLHDIMNPALPVGRTHNRSVTGVLDERSFVYMVKSGRSYGASDEEEQGVIVVVDFTRPWRAGDDSRAAASSAPSSAFASTTDKSSSTTASKANTMETPTPMSRIDSAMDECGKPCDTDAFDSKCWRWSPGQRRRCQSGTCR